MFLRKRVSLNRKGFGGLYRLADDSPMIMLDVNTVKRKKDSKGTVRYEIYSPEGRSVFTDMFDYGDGGLNEISDVIAREYGHGISSMLAQSDSKDFGRVYRAVRTPQEFIRIYGSLIGIDVPASPPYVPIPSVPITIVPEDPVPKGRSHKGTSGPSKGRPKSIPVVPVAEVPEPVPLIPKERTDNGRCLGCTHYHSELPPDKGRCDYHQWAWPAIDIQNCLAYEPKKKDRKRASNEDLIMGKDLKKMLKASLFVSDSIPVNKQVADMIDPSHVIAVRMINHRSGDSLFGITEDEGLPLYVDTKEMSKDILPNEIYRFTRDGNELVMSSADGTTHRYGLTESQPMVNITRIRSKVNFDSAASIDPAQFKRAMSRSKAMRGDNTALAIDEKDIFLNGSSDFTEDFPESMMSVDVGDTYKGNGSGIYLSSHLSSLASSISSKDDPEVCISDDGLMRFSYTPAVEKGYPQSRYSLEYYLAPCTDKELHDTVRRYS